jgi:glycyl-tRNA synthetase beta chain
VRAVLDFWRPAAGEKAPDLSALLAAAVAGYGPLKQPPEKAVASASAFLLDRLAYVLTARGFSPDEVDAVLEAPAADGGRAARALADPQDALHRAQALQKVRREVPDDFAALAEAFKRAKNILSQAAPAADVDPGLFEADAERSLHEAVSALATNGGDDAERLRGLAGLRAPVGRFFDDVLVMAEDPRVRGNRLALLNRTLSLFYRIADISKLGGNS